MCIHRRNHFYVPKQLKIDSTKTFIFMCLRFFLMVAALIELRISNGAMVSLPIIAFFAVLGLASLFVASRRFQA